MRGLAPTTVPRFVVPATSGVGRFQLSAFWGALAAMHRRRHGEGGGGGALSFGVAGRARV